MDELNSYSFCFGTIYGALAVGMVAFALSKIREARLKAGFRNRTLSNFSDAMQANLTPTTVVKNSEQASFNLFMWNLALVIFIGIAVIGLYYVLA
ncbi:MAG TPA: hypothetical protein VEC93_16310 [Anaerolineae bacterium]|nr:hypothetical protein [Anaerolineae bacterium]